MRKERFTSHIYEKRPKEKKKKFYLEKRNLRGEIIVLFKYSYKRN